MRIATACFFLLACGKGESEASVDDAIAACEALCLAEAQGTGCDAEGVERECTPFCGLAAGGVPEDCSDELVAMYTCQQAIEWTCEDSWVTVNDVAMPQQVSPEACQAEMLAADECGSAE